LPRIKGQRASSAHPSSDPAAARPQSLLFTLLAEHMLDRDLAVFAGSFIEVLGRVGVGEHATRATLVRMTERGLLEGQRHGRKIYYRMTPRLVAILNGGRERIWHSGVVNTREDGAWTMLTFSLPEALRKKRHDLRSRLSWAGFGAMQNGVWIAPSEIDVSSIIDELDLSTQARVFHVRPSSPTIPGSVIRDTFDLESLAARYRAFTAHWQHRNARTETDALVLTLRLSTEWLRIIRDDPRVPVHLLPPHWPAIEAQRLFRTLHGSHRKASEALANKLLDTAPPKR
jgi:phenylacetic acid degradation operon negative regulatory protein